MSMDEIKKIREKLKAINCPLDLLEEITNWFLNLGEDNNYYKAVLDGSWPNAKYILETALSKIPQESDANV